MGKLLSRVLGVGIGGCALAMAFLAMMFRMDNPDELPEIVRLDVAVGAALAVAIALVRIPPSGQGGTWWHARTAIGAVVAWAVVSGGLAGCHYEQHRIRSTPPVVGAGGRAEPNAATE